MFEKEKSFIIELQDYISEWTAPLLFAEAVKQHKYTVSRELSLQHKNTFRGCK